MKARAPKLRPDRPVQIRHEHWFGNTPLNGMVWRVTVPRGGKFVTHQVRDGGMHERTSLSEVLEYVRETRRGVADD
jgi:hypothetical protein